MYRPTAFREDDVEKLVSLMKANSFATFPIARAVGVEMKQNLEQNK